MQKLILITFTTFLFTNLQSQTLTVSPNPTYQNALASFTITIADSVSLLVTDNSGKIIQTLLPNSFLTAGIYQDSILLNNQPVGIYYVALRIKSGGSQVKKVI